VLHCKRKEKHRVHIVIQNKSSKYASRQLYAKVSVIYYSTVAVKQQYM